MADITACMYCGWGSLESPHDPTWRRCALCHRVFFIIDGKYQERQPRKESV